jgi:predicted amidohydrolase YtcJ
MVVLSRDLFTIPSREILRTEVLYTILGGKIVYQK